MIVCGTRVLRLSARGTLEMLSIPCSQGIKDKKKKKILAKLGLEAATPVSKQQI